MPTSYSAINVAWHRISLRRAGTLSPSYADAYCAGFVTGLVRIGIEDGIGQEVCGGIVHGQEDLAG